MARKRGCPRSRRYYPPVDHGPRMLKVCVAHGEEVRAATVLRPGATTGALRFRCTVGCDVARNETTNRPIAAYKGRR